MASLDTDQRVDVVDDANRVIGVSRRSDVLPNGLGFRTVHVFVFDRENRLLLQQLRDDHPRSPGKYGSSVAGYLSAGETYFMAAQRKTLSELGICPELRWLGDFRMQDRRSNKFIGLFVAKVFNDSLSFDRDVIRDVIAVDLDQLDVLVKADPNRFTPTFLETYDHFRNQSDR